MSFKSINIDETCEGNTLTKFVGDNVDHNIRTLDGKFTFQAMGVIKVPTPSLSRNTDYLIKRLLKFDEQQILKDHNTTITPYVPAKVNG